MVAIRNAGNEAFRDFSEANNPSSGAHDPVKSEVRSLFNLVDRTLSEARSIKETGILGAESFDDLNAYVAEEGVVGVVIGGTGEDGYYIYTDGTWEFTRPLQDTVAQVVVVGGTGDAIEASVEAGFAPDTVRMFIMAPTATNTGPVSLSIDAVGARPLRNVDGSEMVAGYLQPDAFILFTQTATDYRVIVDQRFQYLSDAATQAANTAVAARDQSQSILNSVNDRADEIEQTITENEEALQAVVDNLEDIQNAGQAAQDAEAARDAAAGYAAAAKRLAIYFAYDDATAEPSAGSLYLDNVPGSATELYISTTEIQGGDVEGWLDSWGVVDNATKGTLTLIDAADPTNWAVYSVTGVSGGTADTFRTVSITHQSSNGAFAGEVAISFAEAGRAGATDYNELDNLPTLGTAAAEDVGAFATAAQGAKADTALQPSDIGTSPGNVVEVGGDGKIADVLLPESSGGASSADIIRLAIDVATLKGDIVMLASGLVDSFESEDGVDTAGSVDETYDVAGYYYGFSEYVETVTSLPAMSGNSAPAGHVASASSTFAGAPYNAFDQTLGDTYWQANALPAWVRRQTPNATTVGGYKLTNRSSTTQNSPTAFTFEGSNNGTDWDVLDTRSGLTWSAGETKSFTVTEGNRAAYSYHRLNITSHTGPAFPIVAELELLQELVTYEMDLRSVAYSALSAPATGRVTVAAKGVGGTITPDTDLIAYVSRDDGATWTQANLTAAETTAAGFTFYSGDADISGQPSGTDMKWRVVTGDAFEVQVGTVALSWE